MDITKEQLDTLLSELKRANDVREREEQRMLATKPAIVSMDTSVPATAADPIEKRLDERIRECEARAPGGLPPVDQFSFVRFFRIQMGRINVEKEAPYEFRCLQATDRKFSEAHKKAIGWASGSSGGYWVGTEFLPQEFVDMYRAALVCKQAGMKVIPCTGAPVLIPKSTAAGTLYWVNQNADITASNATPGQVSFTPHFAAMRTQLSRFLVYSSAGAAEQIIREDLAATLSNGIDDACLEGLGSTASPGPDGMANLASINNVDIGTNGGALTADHLDDMLYELDVDNVPQDGRAFFMHPRTWHGMCGWLKGTTARDFVISGEGSLYQGDAQHAPLKMWRGVPIFLSTNLSIAETKGSGSALANIILARATDQVLTEWGGIELAATDVGGNAWAQNAIEVRATYACDFNTRNPNSICLIDDSTT